MCDQGNDLTASPNPRRHIKDCVSHSVQIFNFNMVTHDPKRRRSQWLIICEFSL